MLRTHAALSRRELAELSGTPLSTIEGVESGAMEPPEQLVARLTATIAVRLRRSGD